jgi:hypothetical protein
VVACVPMFKSLVILRKLVTNYLGTLQQMPLSFLPGLLRELIDFDFKFPAERRAHEKELAYLGSLPVGQLKEWFQGFAEIRLSPQVEGFDWTKAPAQFVEQWSPHLWTTHQLDAFRKAANEYADRLRSAVAPEPPVVPRLGITVIGSTHGAYFSRVKPENGRRQLLDAVAARAKAHPAPYGHWYVDGGQEADHAPALTCVSYKALEPARAVLLRKMQTELDRPGMGPEALRTVLAQMRPSDLGMGTGSNDRSRDQVLDRFEVSLLTEGSGTQIFSTSFAPRQRQEPMNELLSAVPTRPELDAVGSLVDADQGAYYNGLNQQRLPGAEPSSFLVWFEGHGQALAIGPSIPPGTESTSAAELGQLLAWTV